MDESNIKDVNDSNLPNFLIVKDTTFFFFAK